MKAYREAAKNGGKKPSKNKDVCRYCGGQYDKDKARCPSCRQWNVPAPFDAKTDGTVLLSEIAAIDYERMCLGFPWDICFGPGPLNAHKPQGIVVTGTVLLGGGPGAGKSTMSVQICDEATVKTGRECLYVAAEEEAGEVKARAVRLGVRRPDLFRIVPMGANAAIGPIIEARKPCVTIVDSLPGLVPSPEDAVIFCAVFKEYSAPYRCPIIILDHITKDDGFAGFKALEHTVDTCMLLIAEQDEEVRYLTVTKNRFGQANFTKPLLMTEKGIVDYVESEEDED